MDESEILVVCISSGREFTLPVRVAQGTTIAEAIKLSGIEREIPDVDIVNAKKGIFGKLRPDNWILNAGDRLEIYQPLIFDPKEARRRRAAKQARETKKP